MPLNPPEAPRRAVTVRRIEPDEYPAVRELSIAAFGDDPHLGEHPDAVGLRDNTPDDEHR